MPRLRELFTRTFINYDRKRERKYEKPAPLDRPLTTEVELPEYLPTRILTLPAEAINPHKNFQFWYKGQVHAHSEYNGDDGEYTHVEVAQAYADKGYDFISLTGHSTLTPDPGVQGILHITGIESGKSYRHHLLGLDIGTADVDEDLLSDSCPCGNIQARIDYLRDRGGIVVLAHPTASHKHNKYTRHPFKLCGEGWKLSDLGESENYDGIEIFNRHMDARAYWNKLLCSRRRVWGFGVDDFHKPLTGNKKSFNRSWIVVNSYVDKTQADEDILRNDIIQNIKDGNFYTVLRGSDITSNEDTSGDGPIDDIGPALQVSVSENRITITTGPNTNEITTNEIVIICGKFGPLGEINHRYVRFHQGVAPAAIHHTYELTEWEDWVRFEIKQTRKNEEYLALSQPFFVR